LPPADDRLLELPDKRPFSAAYRQYQNTHISLTVITRGKTGKYEKKKEGEEKREKRKLRNVLK